MKTMKIAGIALATALVAAGSYADISVSTTAPAAPGTIHSSLQTGGTNSRIDSDVASNAGRGQLLNIGEAAGTDDQFEISAFTVFSAASAFTGVEKFQVTVFLGAESDWTAGNATEVNPLNGSTCTLLASEEMDAPSAFTANSYMTFSLSNTIVVDENADIGIMLTTTDNGGLTQWYYKENTLGGRIQLTDDGVANGGTGSRGMNMSIQGTAIPEPATLGLVAMFGGAVLFIRRRFMI